MRLVPHNRVLIPNTVAYNCSNFVYFSVHFCAPQGWWCVNRNTTMTQRGIILLCYLTLLLRLIM